MACSPGGSPAAIAALVTVLEQSQTQKDAPTTAVAQHLASVDAALAQQGQPALEPATSQRLVSALCSWLRAHEDSADAACIRQIMMLLAKLVGQDTSTDGIAIQKGLLSTTTDLLKKPGASDAAMIKYCLEVLATLSVVESSDTIISRLGSVPAVVDLLRRHQDSSGVMEDAITALALMAKRTRHRRGIKESDGISLMVDVLKRCIHNASLVIAVCRFLNNFAVKEDLCIAVLQRGGVDALMAAFNSSAIAATRANVASAIWTCSQDCKEVQDTLLASGWLSSLAAVLQANMHDGSLHEAALGIVRGLSRHGQYREDIVNLGFIDATITAMRTFSDSTVLLKEACGLFGNLATAADLRVQLGESGVIEEVIATLSKCRAAEDRKVAKLALGALSNLASSEPNRDVIARTDAAAILLGAARLFMHNENILEYAIGAISHIAVHDECNRQLVCAGGIEALLLFLGDHKEDLHVVSKSLVALRRLLKQSQDRHSAVLRQISCAGLPEGHRGIQLIVEAMQEHVYDETAVREASLLLTSLSSIPSNVTVLLSTAVQPCMKALEVHQHEVTVADALAGMLAQLPIEEDESWTKGLETATLGTSLGAGAPVPC